MFGKYFVSALVVRDGLFEAILAMENVAHIVVEACNAARLAKAREYFTRALGGRESAVVFAQQNERLD